MIVHTADGQCAFQADSHVSGTVTGTSETIIAAPAANSYLRITYLMVNNAASTARTVYFRDGAVAADKFTNYLIEGMIWNSNLVGCYWDLTGGATPNGLVLHSSGAGTINYHVGYRIIKTA